MKRQYTVPAPQLSNVAWVKSSYSSGSGNACVEVADLTATSYAAIAVRDSKAPHGPAVIVAPEAFAAFVGGVRAGRL